MFRRFKNFMYGRYGSDQLNFALIILVVVLSLLNNLLFVILGSHFLYTLLGGGGFCFLPHFLSEYCDETG